MQNDYKKYILLTSTNVLRLCTNDVLQNVGLHLLSQNIDRGQLALQLGTPPRPTQLLPGPFAVVRLGRTTEPGLFNVQH